MSTKWSSAATIRDKLVSALSPESLRRRILIPEQDKNGEEKLSEKTRGPTPTPAPRTFELNKNICDDENEKPAKLESITTSSREIESTSVESKTQEFFSLGTIFYPKNQTLNCFMRLVIMQKMQKSR